MLRSCSGFGDAKKFVRLSGTAFGDYGEAYLRFSVANSLENLIAALLRIEDCVGKNLH